MSYRADAPKFTLAQYREIETAVDDGESLRSLARKLGISRTALRHRMLALGCRPAQPRQVRRPLLSQMERRVWQMRSRGVPAKVVADAVKTTDGSVRQIYLIARRKIAGADSAGEQPLHENGPAP